MQEFIGGCSLIVIGLIMFLFPQKVYQFTEKWKNKNAQMEMSDNYRNILKIVGGVLTSVGIIVAFA